MAENVRVGDLIEVPQLRTVVRLGDIDDAAEAHELSSTFVFTDDAVRALRLLARSFADDGGEGFFLIGSYGSGKSHLLAVLSLWAELGPGAELPSAIRSELDGPPFPRRLLAVRLSLVDHRGDDPLEEAVLGALEGRLRAADRDVALSPARQYLERLRSALSAAEHERLDGLLTADGGLPLSELERRSPHEAVARAREFTARAGIELPTRLADDRRALFERVLREAKAAGYDGVLLLIDELSEFLRAKPSARALSEDARFLQFLGEAGRELPIWTIASLQEALEETGDIARPVLDKIKDRYPVRLRLTTTHVEDLVAGRLVRKKEGADDALAVVHQRISAHFPDLGLSRERFTRLYPLHPRTLAYLDGLTDLFSQARGVVEFVTTHVRGDPLRDIPGMLEADAATLLGVDAIFDHFEPRLREHETYAPYHRKAYAHLQRRAAELFDDDDTRAAAERLLKVLILTEINPLEGRKTVKELAQLLLTRISDLDPSLNYAWLEEAVLAPLADAGDYLVREPADEPYGDRWGIDLSLDVRSLLRSRTRTRVEAARDDEPRLLRRLLAEVGAGPVPLDRLARAERVTTHVGWRHTERAGELVLGEPDELGDDMLAPILTRLDGDDTDFAVIIREPACEPRPVPATLDRPDVLIWTPAPLADDVRGELVEIAVQRAMLREARSGTEEDLKLRELVDGEVKRAEPRARELLAALYLGGSVTPARSRTGLMPLDVPPDARSLEDALAPAVARALSDAHPEFARVMPQTAFINPRSLQQALKVLAADGSLTATAARQKGLTAIIESVLVPLGLVQHRRGRLVLAPDDGDGSLPHAVLASIAAAETATYSDVFLSLRKGPWGLTRLLARTVILALAQTGHVVAMRAGRAIPAMQLGFETVATVDTLTLGRLIDATTQERLRRLEFLLRAPLADDWSLQVQREAWTGFTELAPKLGTQLATLRRLSDRHRSIAALATFDWDRLTRLAGPVQSLVDAVHPSHDARRGLEAVVATQKTNPVEEAMQTGLAHAARFLGDELERYLLMHSWLMDPSLDGLGAPWHEELDELRTALEQTTDVVLDGRMADLVARFDRLRERYRAEYAPQHTTAVGGAAFADVESLHEGPAWSALVALGTLESIEVENDHERVAAMLASILRRRCTRDAHAELFARPTCTCGFTLGERVKRPDTRALRAKIRAGLVAYAAALHAPERRTKLLDHAATLTSGGAAESGLTRLVQALDDGLSADLLAAMIDADLAATIAVALRGERASVVERDIGRLARSLTDRKLDPERLRAAFEDWLSADDLPPGTVIRVVGHRPEDDPDDSRGS